MFSRTDWKMAISVEIRIYCLEIQYFHNGKRGTYVLFNGTFGYIVSILKEHSFRD